MKIRKSKKGFTVVELVIVIAVIAVLAAILIPTFISLDSRAKKSSDQSLVKNLNTALAAQEGEVDDTHNNTMHDAVMDLKKWGYDVSALVTKSGEDLLWNSKTNRFFLSREVDKQLSDTDAKSKVDFWRIQKSFAAEDTYSIYAADEWAGGATVAPLKVGFDVGNRTDITTISYNNDSVAGQEVTFRTNGGTLNVGSSEAIAKGQIYHYGTLSSAILYTENTCFHTYGKIGDTQVKAGKTIVEDKGYVVLTEAAAGTEVEEVGGIVYISEGTDSSSINLSSENLTTLGYDVSGGTITTNGNVDKSFKINNKEELKEFRDLWNKGTAVGSLFKLTSNIDISGEDWLPIGTWEYPFNGTFDGNGKSIIGLTKTRLSSEDIYSTGSTTQYMGVVFGLFGIVGGDDVNIKNLAMNNVNISLPTGIQVSSLIGYAPNHGDFANLSKGGMYWANTATEGKKVLPANYGLDDVNLLNVSCSGSITAKQHTGGLIGKAYNKGEVNATGCTNNCDLVVSNGNAGGIAGYVNGQSSVVFDNCANNGDITSTYMAGIVHSANSMAITVKNSSNSGSLIWAGTTYKTLGYQSSSSDTDKWGFLADATDQGLKTLQNNTNTGTFTCLSYTITGPSDGNYSYSFEDSNGHVLTLNLRDHLFTLKINETITYSGRWAIGSNAANEGSFMMRSYGDWSPLYAEVKNVKTADAFVLTDSNSTFGNYDLSFNIVGEELTTLKTLINICGDDSNSSWNLTI